MKNITILILLTVCLLPRVNAQEQRSNKQQADNLFERYEYFKSVTLYLKIAAKNNASEDVIERVADCYRLMNDYDNAEIWYQKTIAFAGAPAIDHYYYAEILLRNKKFAQAREQYKAYYALENSDQLPFKLATVDSAEKWINASVRSFKIANEQKLNSKYSDWGLNYDDKNGFIFTSDRKISENKKDIATRNGDGYFKMYHFVGDIAFPIELKTQDNPLFKANYHVGPMVLTKSGDTAYITITTTLPRKKLSLDQNIDNATQNLYTRRLQLLVAIKINGKWASFKSFAYNNLKEYSIGNASLSNNGDVIYFTSDMPGGEGKTDIWYCVKQSNGEWDQPVNCGKSVNTKDDESFPTVGNDNTLYFASNGLPGMGGLDIFKIKGERSTWSKPVNLKYPINSTSDDFYFLTRDTLSGYFSSNREGGKGNDDIYSFGYTPPPVILASAPLKTAGNKPNLSSAVPSPQDPSAILTLKKGQSLILNNIYYDLNKWSIRPDAAVQLNKLATILRSHPTIRIELSAHTDSRAPSVYNLTLSNQRAAAAVDYLVKKGVARKRLVAKGYGDTKLLNQCVKGEYCSEEDHQVNRRTEIRVLSE